MTYDVSAHPVEKNASKFVYVTTKSTIDQHPTKKSSVNTHLSCVGMISDKLTLQNNILFRPAANIQPKTSKIKTFDEKFDPEKAKELKYVHICIHTYIYIYIFIYIYIYIYVYI